MFPLCLSCSNLGLSALSKPYFSGKSLCWTLTHRSSWTRIPTLPAFQVCGDVLMNLASGSPILTFCFDLWCFPFRLFYFVLGAGCGFAAYRTLQPTRRSLRISMCTSCSRRSGMNFCLQLLEIKSFCGTRRQMVAAFQFWDRMVNCVFERTGHFNIRSLRMIRVISAACSPPFTAQAYWPKQTDKSHQPTDVESMKTMIGFWGTLFTVTLLLSRRKQGKLCGATLRQDFATENNRIEKEITANSQVCHT